MNHNVQKLKKMLLPSQRGNLLTFNILLWLETLPWVFIVNPGTGPLCL